MTPAIRVTVLLALLLPLPALAQLSAPATALGVPAVPAGQNVEAIGAAAAAQVLSDGLNGAATGAIVTEMPGRVLLGSGTEAASPPRGRGFMEPTFAPLPSTPIVPQGGQPAFSAGYATPGFFTMQQDRGPAAVGNLYTAPGLRDPLTATAP